MRRGQGLSPGHTDFRDSSVMAAKSFEQNLLNFRSETLPAGEKRRTAVTWVRKPLGAFINKSGASLLAQMVYNLPVMQETGFNPSVRKIPWKRKWQLTPVFLPRKFHDRGAWWAIVHGVCRTKKRESLFGAQRRGPYAQGQGLTNGQDSSFQQYNFPWNGSNNVPCASIKTKLDSTDS